MEPEQRRLLAAWAAQFALRACGKGDDPAYAEVLASLDAGVPVFPEEAQKELRKAGSTGYGTQTPPEFMALTALEAAVGPNTSFAALDAVWSALATLPMVEDRRQWGTKLRYDDWRLQQPRSPKGQARLDRDLRAFWPEVFRRVNLEPPAGVIPPDPGPARPEDDPPSWAKIAPWPFEPWARTSSVWTGSELVVLGAPEPRMRADHRWEADPDAPRPSGAYDPTANRWRKLTPPPFANSAQLAAAGEHVVALVHPWSHDAPQELWTYSLPADTWAPTPLPTGLGEYERWYGAVAAGPSVALWTASHDHGVTVHLLDPASGTWRRAPTWSRAGVRPAQLLGLLDGRLVMMGVDHDQEAEDRHIAALMARHGVPEGESGAVFAFVETSDGREDPAAPWRASVLPPGGEAWDAIAAPGPISSVGRGQNWHVVGRTLILPAPAPYGGILDLDASQWRPVPATRIPDRGSDFFDRDDAYGCTGGDFLFFAKNAFDVRRGVWWEVPEQPERAYEPVIAWAGNRLVVFANEVEKSSGDGRKPRKYAWRWGAPDAT